MVILRCLTCQKPNWIKSYNIKHNKNNFLFLAISKKKAWKFTTQKWPFYDPFWPLFRQLHKIFQKTEIQTVILRCLMGWISIGSRAMAYFFFLACFCLPNPNSLKLNWVRKWQYIQGLSTGFDILWSPVLYTVGL